VNGIAVVGGKDQLSLVVFVGLVNGHNKVAFDLVHTVRAHKLGVGNGHLSFGKAVGNVVGQRIGLGGVNAADGNADHQSN